MQVKSAAAHENLVRPTVEEEGRKGCRLSSGWRARVPSLFVSPKAVSSALPCSGEDLSIDHRCTLKDLFVQLLWPALPPAFSLNTRQLIAAHGAFESGWGKSKAYVQGNNPFNITRNPNVSGAIVLGKDVEFSGGKMLQIVQRFASYPTLEDAVQHYLGFIRNTRYLAAYESLINSDVTGFVTSLRAGGYYTLPVPAYLAGVQSCLSSVKSLTVDLKLE